VQVHYNMMRTGIRSGLTWVLRISLGGLRRSETRHRNRRGSRPEKARLNAFHSKTIAGALTGVRAPSVTSPALNTVAQGRSRTRVRLAGTMLADQVLDVPPT
jgi:hypothetical protein